MEPDLRWNETNTSELAAFTSVRARVSIGFLSVGGHVQRSPEWTPELLCRGLSSGSSVRLPVGIRLDATYLISVSVPARSCATHASERKLRII